VTLLPESKVRFLQAWFPRTIDGTRLTRVARALRTPRTKMNNLEEMLLHWPGGRQRLLIARTQVDEFLAGIRAMSPNVEVTGFETVYSQPAILAEKPTPSEIIRIPVRTGIVRWMTFDAGINAVGFVYAIAVITVIVFFTQPPVVVILGMGAILLIAIVNSFLSYPEYRRYLLVPRELVIVPEQVLIAHTTQRRERIPVSAIRTIIAHHFRERGWIKREWVEVAYLQEGETHSIFFPNIALFDATAFIAVLHSMNPSIVLDGFDDTPT